VNDKTFHEIYEYGFAEAVRAKTNGVMASYNLVNGTYASENQEILGKALKTELDFQGFAIVNCLDLRHVPPSQQFSID